MCAKIGMGLAIVAMILLPVDLAMARGGGGGHSGGHGGGGGHSGGGHSGGGHSGGGHSGGGHSGGGHSGGGHSGGGHSGGGVGASQGGGSGGGFQSSGVPSVRSFNSSAAGGFSGGARNFSRGDSGTKAFKSGDGANTFRSFSRGDNQASGPSGAMRSFRGPSTNPSGNLSGGTSGNAVGSGGTWNKNLGDGGRSNRSTFMKNNFPNQTFNVPKAGDNAGRYQANRFNGAGSSAGSLDRGNSFVRSQNINNKDLKHWTHNNGNSGKGDWNKGDWSKGNWNKNNWNQWNKGNWAGNAHHHHHHGGNNFFFSPWFGFGGLWGGWGWPYYGWGYGYGYPLYATNLYGYGYGYGYNYPYYANYATTYAAAPVAAPANQAAALNQADPAPAAAGDFADQGEAGFKAGRYQQAARDWQHALVDDPKNGALMMLMAQALFALGQYDEAAGAVQAGMQMLPEDKWGVVIANYAQLYGSTQDYTDQVKALEKARNAQPDSPALRFLLGFHFGYLGYPKQAVREVDRGLTLAPRDFGARKVRDIFAAKWPDAPPLPAAAVEAAKEFEKETGQAPGSEPAPPAAQPPAGKPASPPAPKDEEPGTPS